MTYFCIVFVSAPYRASVWLFACVCSQYITIRNSKPVRSCSLNVAKTAATPQWRRQGDNYCAERWLQLSYFISRLTRRKRKSHLRRMYNTAVRGCGLLNASLRSQSHHTQSMHWVIWILELTVKVPILRQPRLIHFRTTWMYSHSTKTFVKLIAYLFTVFLVAHADWHWLIVVVCQDFSSRRGRQTDEAASKLPQGGSCVAPCLRLRVATR